MLRVRHTAHLWGDPERALPCDYVGLLMLLYYSRAARPLQFVYAYIALFRVRRLVGDQQYDSRRLLGCGVENRTARKAREGISYLGRTR